ncbi:MAG: UTP--glucose-1-phosphate uridylyltransferase [bacterium]|jgi:galactokinase/mevalonate kinase-like predicted kinase|nr:UTP--glucose-1-phosphate uridylyltransferase [bacterium]
MKNPFLETITSSDPALRNRAIRDLAEPLLHPQLLACCAELEAFRRRSDNLYERVRACLFLFHLYRFHLMEAMETPRQGRIPYLAVENILDRRFEEALALLLDEVRLAGSSGTLYSAIAECYHALTFETLTDQVRKSVRASRGNQWMFRAGYAPNHPIRIRKELRSRDESTGLYPILCEKTPVRLDLSHSGWSDIFFLGMDYPEGAQVLNISINLGVHGRDKVVKPPIETYVRVVDEPVLRLTSIDLASTKDIHHLEELFNFGNDYLGLLKAGVISSGLISPSYEGTGQSLAHILEQAIGPGQGLELVTKVNDIPKGSRLAVSTNLLASIIVALMRATGQAPHLTGALDENSRRLAASRAILGEWLGGSGGGWQDSGGIWPGIKKISGVEAAEDDPEHGISKGRLLPCHEVWDAQKVRSVRDKLAQSLVLIHGGMAQNVGPILEMVTEKYLLRGKSEWQARQTMHVVFQQICEALYEEDMQRLGALTTKNWDELLQTIIPWITNHFTESIIRKAKAQFGSDFWGFLMTGGMSGGGMAMVVAPERRTEFVEAIQQIMLETKRELQTALPFAIDPIVYDFAINEQGTVSTLRKGVDSMMPERYYALQIPEMVSLPSKQVAATRGLDLDHFINHCQETGELVSTLKTLVNNLFPLQAANSKTSRADWEAEVEKIKNENGFDPIQQEQLRADLRQGRIGLARNRLPVDLEIADVEDQDIFFVEPHVPNNARALGQHALEQGEVAVVSLAAGMGSRWTTGAGVVKALSPFVKYAGQHRSFLEIHLAKSRAVMERFGTSIPHVFTTSYLTHAPIATTISRENQYGYAGPLFLSPGRFISHRLIPMVRDLMFLWEEMPQEMLDENKQKVREAVREALKDWARVSGEGNDYKDNIPLQRFNPPGHFYEIPNMIQNGVLARMLQKQPSLKYLMVHNIDTLGANLDPAILGLHIQSGKALSFEVIPKRFEDRGGGLARVNGRVRLLEGLAQPHESDEFKLRFYNTLTTWIDIDQLLHLFGLTRTDLDGDPATLSAAVRQMAARIPTYVTIKEVKRRWGHGQEDVFPVAQFEKLWGDITSLNEASCFYMVVPRFRGQQLKDPSQLDPWANDGSMAYVETLCKF